MPRRRGSWTVSVVVCATLTVGGCSDGGADPNGEQTGDGAATSAVAADDAAATSQAPGSAQPGDAAISLAEGVLVPEGPVGEQLTWVLDTVNTPGAPSPDRGPEHFAPSFLDQVPAEQLPAVLEQLRALAPMTVTAIQTGPTTASASVEAAEPLVIEMALDDDGLISGLLFSPDPLADRPASTDFGEIESELSGLVDEHHVLTARVEDGACVPVYQSQADRSAPIGSVFKLYVLAAVVDAVERGDLAWDDGLVVTEAVKSLPSGRLQEEPAGTEVSV